MNYNQKVGRFGEKIACDYLIKKGYKIINQNIKISFQEIDIISRQGKMLVFVEVKTRTNLNYGEAEDVVGEVKINNLKRAIQGYLVANKLSSQNIRLDLIVIDVIKASKTAKIKHYLDIF